MVPTSYGGGLWWLSGLHACSLEPPSAGDVLAMLFSWMIIKAWIFISWRESLMSFPSPSLLNCMIGMLVCLVFWCTRYKWLCPSATLAFERSAILQHFIVWQNSVRHSFYDFTVAVPFLSSRSLIFSQQLFIHAAVSLSLPPIPTPFQHPRLQPISLENHIPTTSPNPPIPKPRPPIHRLPYPRHRSLLAF
jgi:hypothetical protein